MIRIHFILLVIILLISYINCQTNTFPSSGNVGIGITTPNYPLEIIDDSEIFQLYARNLNYGRGGLRIGNYGILQCHIDVGNGYHRMLLGEGVYYDPNDKLYKLNNATYDRAAIEFLNSGHIGFFSESLDRSLQSSMTQSEWRGIERVRITNNGYVGIGTTTPDQKLTVAGTIKARELIVEENAGSDFVFAEDYDLMLLEELEQSIKQNKHLPEIPSAEEMKQNGVGVAELQMKLLQKIEELTLYVINQNKKLEQKDKKIEQMEKRIQRLEKK